MRRLLRRSRPGPEPCEHLAEVGDVQPLTEGCGECEALGHKWVHLRLCLGCGNVGCCDSSFNRHASKHAREAGHPLMRSLEPGEDWTWCVEHGRMVA